MMLILVFIILLILVILIYYKVRIQKEKLKITLGEKIVIGGLVYNCEKYLDPVFNNITKILSRFQSFEIVVVIDKGSDNSLKVLEKWKTKLTHMTIIKGKKTSAIRTKNICIARNKMLSKIFEYYNMEPFSHFIIMDMDDVCSSPINLKVFDEAWNRRDEWEAITFNRIPYYDVWALSYDPMIISAFHWKYDGVKQMQEAIHQRMENWSKEKLFPVYSAFAGFGIYKSNPFVFLRYEWKFQKSIEFLTPEMKRLNEDAMHPNTFTGLENQEMDCEHRYFHFDATFNHNARIRILMKTLFPKPVHLKG